MATFTPPTDDTVRYGVTYGADGMSRHYNSTARRLWRFFQPESRGKNVYLLTDGTYTEVDQRDQGQIVKIYLGGHQNPVDAGEVASLTAAGYGAYIS